jgi:hypothetical protein
LAISTSSCALKKCTDAASGSAAKHLSIIASASSIRIDGGEARKDAYAATMS